MFSVRNAIATLVLIAMAQTAFAQTPKFPNRPLRAIVGIAPGGGMDTISRAHCGRA